MHKLAVLSRPLFVIEASPSENEAAGEHMISIGPNLEKLGDSDTPQFDEELKVIARRKDEAEKCHSAIFPQDSMQHGNTLRAYQMHDNLPGDVLDVFYDMGFIELN